MLFLGAAATLGRLIEFAVVAILAVEAEAVAEETAVATVTKGEGDG